MVEAENYTEDPDLIQRVNEICKERQPFKHIQAMDYPRMAGSPESDQAVEYIANVFKDYGYTPVIEEFFLPEHHLLPKLLLPLLIITWGILSCLNVFLSSGIGEYIIAFLILLVPILVLVVIFKLEIFFKKMIDGNYKKIQKLTKLIENGEYKGAIKKGKNIYVEYVPEEYNTHLYITAHHDSTTLKLSMKVIRLCMVVGFLSGIIYISIFLIHYLLKLASGFDLVSKNPIFFIVLLGIFLISLSFVLISRAFRTNKSHGAIDNLTGTSVILELANLVKLLKPKLKITFIAFAAEEVGLFGSAYHYNTHKESFESEKIHIVSIDMVGEIPPLSFVKKIKPFLGIPMDLTFNDQIKKLAQRLGIDLKFRKFIYPGSDFACWFLNGYPANWVMTPSKYIHSEQDIAQNVNQDLLVACLKLFTAYFLEHKDIN